MTDTKVQRFKFTIPIIKTSVKIVKDKDGNEIEERYVEGIASGTELDLHGDRMAPSAIESMAKSLKQHVIALNAEHDTSWLGELGDIDKLEIAENNDLGIKAKLNEMSSAKDLWYALIEKNKKLGLSIGGYVKDYETVKEGKGDDAKWVRLYKEIDLDHIAVTSSPAYPKSWVSSIAKSVKKNDRKLIKKVKKKKKEKSIRSQKDKKLRTLARKIVKRIQSMEADLLLELTYTGLQSCDESLLLIINESLNMSEKDISLEAEKAKKKANTEKSESKDEKDKALATPENGKLDKDKDKGEKASKSDKEAKSEKDETKSEKDDKEKASVKKAEKKSVKAEKKSVKKVEEKAEKESADDEKAELLKTVKDMSKGLKEVLKSNEKLAERVEELESQPSSRKTVEVHKSIGDEESNDKTAEELTKERNKKIEAVRKEHSNDPNLFARVQRIRVEYAQKVQE